jgi:hypothetical protein
MRNLRGRLVFCVGLAAACWTLASSHADAQTWRTMTSARQVWDRELTDVDIEYGAGTLRVAPAEAPFLYRMEIRYDADIFAPIADFDAEERTLQLGVESAGRGRRSLNMREGSTATVLLSREVPVELDLEFGAGKADIQLGGMAIQQLEISTGASETSIGFDAPNTVVAERITIEAGAADLEVLGLGNARAEQITFRGGVGSTVLDFSGAWDRSVTASVEMGIGAVTLRLPRGPGIRIDRSSFLTSFEATDLERRGDSYYSAGWDSAEQRITIDLSAALGSIEIDWID